MSDLWARRLARGGPRLLAAALVALSVAGLGCRQIAGVEDIVPPSDASSVADGKSTDAAIDRDQKGDAVACVGKLEGGSTGKCGCPGCTQLAHGLKVPLSLVLVGSDLYVLSYGTAAGEGSLVRVSTSGGAPETIQSGLSFPIGLLSDGEDLYWSSEDEAGHGIVEKCSTSGGKPTTLASGLTAIRDVLYKGYAFVSTRTLMALAGPDLYFFDFDASGVWSVLRVPKTGGTPRPFFPVPGVDAGPLGTASPIAMISDARSLYFLAGSSAYVTFQGILAVPLSGGPPIPVIDDLNGPSSLALDGTRIVFTDLGTTPTRGTLQSVGSSGGTPTFLAQNLAAPWSVVVDDGYVYCASLGNFGDPPEGSILKVDTGGKHSIDKLLEAPQPADLVVDATRVYWVDATCGTVMTLPK
jgi:hypothetical protein